MKKNKDKVKIKIKKYPEGGNIAEHYGYTAQEFSALPNKQELIDEYFKNKGYVKDINTGAYKPANISNDIVKDGPPPTTAIYDFTKYYGQTKLTSDQWSKLMPDVQGEYYHKALEAAGFTKLGTNKYAGPNVDVNEAKNLISSLKDGGEIEQYIPGIIGAATSMIPVVGPFISPIATQLTKAQIDKKNAVENYKTTENVMTNNRYGVFKNGGKLKPLYLKAISGGKLDHIYNDMYIANGKSHTEGGIKADTDMDNNPNIEFEGGELYSDDKKYIINKDVSKPYLKAFKALSGRTDNISTTTSEILKADMITANETRKLKLNIKNKDNKKFEDGDPLDKFLTNPVYYSQLDKFQEIYPTPITLSPTPLFKTNIVEPEMKQTANIAVNSPYDNVSDTGINDDSIGMTQGDKLQLLGNSIAPLYNIARGIFDKSEVLKTSDYINPYSSNILSELKDRYYNSQTVQNQIDRSVNAAMDNINNNTSSDSVRRTNIQNLFNNAMMQRSNADLQGQQMNNQYKADLANTMNSLGQQSVAAKQYTTEYNAQSKGAKDALISAGVSQLGQGLTNVGLFKNQNTLNNLQLKTLEDLVTNYGFDKAAITKLLNAGYTSEEIIKFLK